MRMRSGPASLAGRAARAVAERVAAFAAFAAFAPVVAFVVAFVVFAVAFFIAVTSVPLSLEPIGPAAGSVITDYADHANSVVRGPCERP